MAVLLALLSVRGWIMVKAPPQCGKTTILQLLGVYAQARGVRVFYVSFADVHTRNVVDIVKKRTGSTLEELAAGKILLSCFFCACLSLYLPHCLWIGQLGLENISGMMTMFLVTADWDGDARALRYQMRLCSRLSLVKARQGSSAAL